MATLATVCDRVFPVEPKLKRWHAYTPCTTGLLHRSTPHRTPDSWALSPSPVPTTMPTKRRELLCPLEVLPLEGWHRVPSRRALPLLRRSYELMRQSQILHAASPPLLLVVFAGCCQPLLDEGPSRRYLCESFLGCLDPYPAGLQKCTCPLLPSATSTFPAWDTGRHARMTRSATSERPSISRRQSFLYVQASKFACHPDRSHRCSQSARRPWRLHPSRTYVVTSIRIGYASRPNRAIDDRGLSPH